MYAWPVVQSLILFFKIKIFLRDTNTRRKNKYYIWSCRPNRRLQKRCIIVGKWYTINNPKCFI